MSFDSTIARLHERMTERMNVNTGTGGDKRLWMHPKTLREMKKHILTIPGQSIDTFYIHETIKGRWEKEKNIL